MEHRVSLSRARQLLPFVEFFGGMGSPIGRLLQRNGLPPLDCLGLDVFVSTRMMQGFLRDAASQEGADALGWRVYSQEDVSSIIGPTLAGGFYSSPSLFTALTRLGALVPRESSTLQIWLADRGDSLHLCHRSPIEDEIGFHCLSGGRTAGLISMVRSFAGPDWAPTECGIVGDHGECAMAREALPATRIVRTSEFAWMRLPRSIGALPPRLRLPPESGSIPSAEPIEAPHGLVDSLAELLRPYLSHGPPSIHVAAEMVGTSPRSLQRALKAGGVTYRELLGRVKLNMARDLLSRPEPSVNEIAQSTGFSDHAHFTRFFKAMTGLAPRDYRATRLS